MTGNAESSGRRRLLVAKGTFEAMRGAERDLIRNLPALAQEFDVTVATLQPSKELKNCIRKHSIPYYTLILSGNHLQVQSRGY